MRSALRRYGPELGLALFICLNAVAMLVTRLGQTVPFHFIWISLSLAYGYRTWRRPWTFGALAGVCVLTTACLVIAVGWDGLDPAELAEVPLMALVFLANMAHARRREAALAEVRLAAAELAHQRELERDFLRDASHLLRTPVTIARGFTELLRGDLEDDAQVAEADIVLRELDSMTRISSRLLLLTSTRLDELLDHADVDVADLLRQAETRWSPTAARLWRVTTEPCVIDGDAGLLESALDALVENALRHTEDGDEIAVRCSQHGGRVVIDVADSGGGIPEELLPALFERKWRRSSPGERSGTGLGLAIVKAIVTAHGGTVSATRSRSGGAEFTLTLPGQPHGLPRQRRPHGQPTGADRGAVDLPESQHS